MSFQPRDWVFVDESKARGYYLAAAATQPFARADIERAIRGLLKPGQRRIHFKSESHSRRRELLAEFGRIGLRTTIYQVKGANDRAGRALCLTGLVDDLLSAGASNLLIEQDDSLVASDRRLIRNQLTHGARVDQLAYCHVRPTEYPLLWVSDAVAWCHQAGGDWLRRAEPLVDELKRL